MGTIREHLNGYCLPLFLYCIHLLIWHDLGFSPVRTGLRRSSCTTTRTRAGDRENRSFEFPLACKPRPVRRIPVDAGFLRPNHRSLLHNVVHDIKMPHGSPSREPFSLRQSSVPSLDGGSVRFGQKVSMASHGLDIGHYRKLRMWTLPLDAGGHQAFYSGF